MTIEQFEDFADIIDTRTPAEYARDCLPRAVNFAVLSNAEHAAVGALGQHDNHAARRYGARLVASNIATMLAQPYFTNRPRNWSPLVYCSRGGQRSGSLVEVMRRVGWLPQQLSGGYKTYRRFVLQQLPQLINRHSYCVIAGKTGVGKTQLLAALAACGAAVLDLEALANHRGSVFGGHRSLGTQPSQRRFESLLWSALKALPVDAPIFVEAESRMIGRLRIPEALIVQMHAGQCFHIDAPLAERVAFVQKNYRAFCEDSALFTATIQSLLPFAGHQKIAQWQADYEQRAWSPLLSDLLSAYYDERYEKALKKHYPAAATSQTITINPNDEATMSAAAQAILTAAQPTCLRAGVALADAHSTTSPAK